MSKIEVSTTVVPTSAPVAACTVAAVAAALALSVAPEANADVAVFTPVADVTLIQPDGVQEYALGAAYSMFCGRVGTQGSGTLRRALARWDLSSIPAGSTVTAATLKVYMSQGAAGSQTCTLHRMLASWGEGASFAFGGGGSPAMEPDATWINRFYPGTPWITPGGDFVATVSGSKSINGVGSWTFASTATMVADVQGWVNAPANNHGWMIRGNEAVLQTAKRFDCHEQPGDPSHWPTLTVTYTPPAHPVGDINGDYKVDGADLGMLLAAWGGTGVSDLDHNGQVDGADLGMLLAHWTP